MTDSTPLSPPPDDGAERAERVEHRWATVSVAVLVLFVAVATFAPLHLAAMPQNSWQGIRRSPGVSKRALRLEI